jgi:hypothetical protein
MEHKWKKSSPELARVLDAALIRFTCDKRPMFGSPVFWINNVCKPGESPDPHVGLDQYG